MKKWLAKKFMALALWLEPETFPDIKKLAISYMVARTDVEKYQKEYNTSYEQAQKELLAETEKQARYSIALGLKENNLIHIKKKIGAFCSEVTASLYIYAS